MSLEQVPRPRRPPSPQVLAVSGAVAVYVGLVLLWMVSLPLFAIGDESAHVGYAAAVAQGELPVVRSERVNTFPELGQSGRLHYLSNHPPLYHALIAPLVTAADHSSHPRAFLLLARGLTAALGGLAIALVALTVRELFRPGWARTVATIAALAVCGSLPAMVGSTATIRNDSLTLLMVSAVVLVLARALRRGLRARTVVLVAVLCALGMLSRVAFLPVWLLAAGAVAVLCVWPGLEWRRPRAPDVRRGLAALVTVIVVPVLGAGWFYALSLRRYGDLTGGSVVYPSVADRPWAPGAEDGLFTFMMLPSSWWSQVRQLGGGPPSLQPHVHPVHAVLGALVVGVLLLLAAIAARRTGRTGVQTSSARWIWSALALIAIATYAELASHVTHRGVDTQRYLLDALGFWGAVWALVVVAASRRWGAVLLTLATLLLAAGTVVYAVDLIADRTGTVADTWYGTLVRGTSLAGFPGAQVWVAGLLGVVSGGVVLLLVGLLRLDPGGGAGREDAARARDREALP